MTNAPRQCPKCGSTLAPDAPEGLCPACLMAGALPTDATIKLTPSLRSEGMLVEAVGDRIGHYKLREQIGEGGFGTVWVAEQEQPVRRRVALKIIKLGMDTKEVIARFEQERQALAMMDHPNIAKVFDAGATESGRPYFVMELVRGVKITDYCDERQLSTAERIELFVTVCQAVQHAHQKGIIHRDLKPSNILVTVNDAVAVPKVIDFGVAKATQGRLAEHTIYTQFQQMIGTPLYMSPEQADMTSLDVDTRSDIYSLGVLLYELLTGRTPIDEATLRKAGLDEMRRMIREVDPPRPSMRLKTLAGDDLTTTAKRRHTEPAKLPSALRGDLDWIVMKCLEKDRTRRYDTANGIALDLRRHLQNGIVTARPPTAGYLLGKLIRRNRLAFATGAAIVASLVIGIAVSTWQAVRATRAEKVTAAERDAKEQARLEAEAVSALMLEVFRSPDPFRDGRTITVAETLDKAAKKLDTDLAAQPVQKARLQVTLGQTYGALGLVQQGIPLAEQGHRYFRETFGPEHPRTLASMGTLASLYLAAGRREEALKLSEELRRLRLKTAGPEHPDSLLAMTLVGEAYQAAGRNDDALKVNEELLALRRKLDGPSHANTIGTMSNLALSYAAVGRANDALKLQEEVLALTRTVNGPEHPNTFAAMNNLAVSYEPAKRHDEALKLRQDALDLAKKIFGPEHPETITAMTNLASSYRAAAGKGPDRKMREALLSFTLHMKALELSRKVLGPEHPNTLGNMTNMAIAYRENSQDDKAIPLQEEALATKRRVLPANHPFLASAIGSLAHLYQKAGRTDEALKLWEELVTFHRTVHGPAHRQTLAAMQSLATAYRVKGEAAKAEPIEKEIEATKAKAGP